MGSIVAAALPALFAAGVTIAAEISPGGARQNSTWFVDLGAGLGVARATSLLYNDPLGVPFTKTPVSGSNVILGNLANTHKSLVATASLGRFVSDDTYVRGTYRNFGRAGASGSATFGPADFQQVQTITAEGGFIGLGFIYRFTEHFYLDASGEVGAAFMRSGGVHDANLFPQPFPKRKLANLAGGGGVALGYTVTGNLDLLLSVGYDHLGVALTGITCHCSRPDAPLGLSEYLSSQLSVIPVLVGIRVRM